MTGHGEPAGILGKDGDSYIDLDSFDYYVKTDGSWSKAGNIKGADGASGSGTGVNGKDGKDGTNGVDGKDGKDGRDGVDGKDGQDAITYVPCIFNNWDGTKLYEFYFEKGAAAVYGGDTPTKEDTTVDGHTAHWTFAGWDKPLESVTKPTIFTAQFESLVNVTFSNYDGALLESKSINFGETPSYTGETPAKPSEADGSTTIEWTFKGWDKSLGPIYEDTAYTAVFDSPNAIKCTFVNEDGSVLGYSYCGKGGKAVYNGETPTKDEVNNDGTITRYAFSGWDKSMTNMQADATLTAQYEESYFYACEFRDWDNALLKEVVVPQNGTASYGSTPHRDPEADGDNVTEYTFSAWDKSTSGITAPTTFTATYTSKTYEGYIVTFNDPSGRELAKSPVATGENAAYHGAMAEVVDACYSYDSANVTMFVGWSDTLENIAAAKTVTAVTKTISRRQNGEYGQTAVADPDLIAELDKVASPNAQGYYEYGGERYSRTAAIDNRYLWTWRKVEPIKWRYLRETTDGVAEFMSEKVLMTHVWNSSSSDYEDGTHANNYAKSDIRTWLNGDFLEQAFYYDDSLVQKVTVDNSPSTTGYSSNQYACGNTSDRIYLPSVEDLTNTAYGFSYGQYTSDANRIGYDVDGNAQWWWTRSPGSDSSDYARYVYSGGVVTSGLVYFTYGVRPCVQLKIS